MMTNKGLSLQFIKSLPTKVFGTAGLHQKLLAFAWIGPLFREMPGDISMWKETEAGSVD